MKDPILEEVREYKRWWGEEIFRDPEGHAERVKQWRAVIKAKIAASPPDDGDLFYRYPDTEPMRIPPIKEHLKALAEMKRERYPKDRRRRRIWKRAAKKRAAAAAATAVATPVS
jgi:hypothetical protein